MVEQNRDFKGVWIPRDIWESTDLSLQEKVFLVEIDSLDQASGCYASNDYFAGFFSLQKKRAAEVISELVRKGYILRELQYKANSKQIDRRILRINKDRPSPLKKGDPPPEKRDTLPLKRGIDNNTVYKVSKETRGKPISLESEELISFEKILRETVISTGGFKTRFTPNSKVIKNTYQYLREIKDNTFLHRPLEAKPLEGMDTHRINTTMDNRRLRAVLLKASRNWAKACDSPDIFTPDKKPSLDAWFYTGPPNSKGMSWFLYCATDNMKENYNQEQRGMVEGLKKYIDKFEPGAHKLRDKLYNKSDTKYWGDREWITFYSTMKALMVWRLESKESLKAKNDSWAILFGSLGKTFDTIRHFLDDMYGGKAYPKFLEPKGTNWNKFRQWLNAGWDFDL